MRAHYTRVAAYALCFDQDRLLLVHNFDPGGEQYWSLPGGGVDFGEDPFDAVIREVFEETGYHVHVDRLIGVDSRTRDFGPRRRFGSGGVLHSMGVYYEVTVTGGELRNEVDGSTDLAEWVPLDEVSGRERSQIIDIGLDLHRTHPADGHVVIPAVEGQLHH